jgi:antagonist of KipI
MSIRIIKKGIADSIQDAGRYGFQHIGVQSNGYMDYLSAQLANYILNNPIINPVIEIHFPSSTFCFETENTIAITGANFIAVLNEKSVQMNKPIKVHKGDTLQFLQPIQGRIAYIAFKGTLQNDQWLHSFSYAGKRLKLGDRLLINKSNHPPIDTKDPIALQNLCSTIEKQVFKQAPFAFIPGPAWNDLNTDSIQKILNEPFKTSLQSNRMGFQLSGPSLSLTKSKSYLSAAVTKGTMQLLPNGELIVLMADHQTIGGYPNLGQINLVDLPRLAQLNNDTTIYFSLTNVDNAQQQYQSLQNRFTN